jgi:hypothetical protein
VTLDLPFPFSQSDRDLWPPAVAGTLPLGLDGEVVVTTVGGEPAAGGQPAVPGEPAVAFTPSAGARALLDVLFEKLKEVGRGDQVRGHVRLAGSVLGTGAVDHARWFWLVEQVTHLVLTARRESPLRLAPARAAIALSVARDALGAGLPSGITVRPGAIDLANARRAARRIFGNGVQERALRLVVDERYRTSGEAVRDGLDTVDIQMELLNAADPAADVTARLAAGETVDGVLTDELHTEPVLALGGFRKPTAL